MTQTQIILAFMTKCEQARKRYNELNAAAREHNNDATVEAANDAAHEYSNWSIAIDKLNSVLQEYAPTPAEIERMDIEASNRKSMGR